MRLYRLLAMCSLCRFFFFNDTATTEIYTLSLHDALPISTPSRWTPLALSVFLHCVVALLLTLLKKDGERSEERFSRNAETDLVCRLLLEKKKKNDATLGQCDHLV